MTGCNVCEPGGERALLDVGDGCWYADACCPGQEPVVGPVDAASALALLRLSALTKQTQH